jgi:hypothetical protein
MPSSDVVLLAAVIRTNVSEECSTSFIRVTRIGELGTTLAVTTSPVLVTLMMEVLRSFQTSVLNKRHRV